MSPQARYDLIRISESRLGLIGKPWLSPIPPAPVQPGASWGRIVPTLLAIATIAAVAAAGGK